MVDSVNFNSPFYNKSCFVNPDNTSVVPGGKPLFSFQNNQNNTIGIERTTTTVSAEPAETPEAGTILQNWNLQPLTRILTQEEVEQDIYNINTAENTPLKPTLNFNSADGKNMLKYLSFDSSTFENTPKENLPDGFNPDEIIEKGKDAGCNVSKMHEMGYTGKDINVAIIDSAIITNHEEIRNNLQSYTEGGNFR